MDIKDFKTVKVEVLIGLYKGLLDPKGKTAYTPADIASLIGWTGGVQYLRKALTSLTNEKLVYSRQGLYELTEQGILLHEQKVAKFVPAADRVVTLDHNNQDEKAIELALDQVEQAVRTINHAFENEPEARQAALAEVSALKRLWSGTAVRLDAFKERARAVLAWISERGAAAVLEELCKHAIKLILGWS